MVEKKFDRRFVPRKQPINFSHEIGQLIEKFPPPPAWIEKIPLIDSSKISDTVNFWSFSDDNEFPRIVSQALQQAGISGLEEKSSIYGAIEAASYPPRIKGIPIRPLGDDDALLRVGDIRQLSVEELEQFDMIRSQPHAALILKKLFGDESKTHG